MQGQTIGKVGIIVNTRKPHAGKLLDELKNWLAKRDKEVLDNTARKPEDIIREAELLVCLGGDGTILNIADKMIERSVPVLGVNLGSLGFLTEVKEEEVFEELSSIFLGNYHLEERIMLNALVKSENDPQGRRFQALNDVVINREGLTRYLYVDIKAGGESLMRFSGDGVIVSTPTGSTAYSLSAGGPFVYPTLNNFVVTPLCAHSLLVRPIVLPVDKKVVVKIECEKEGESANLVCDGQESIEIKKDNVVEISRAAVPLKLISSSKRGYLETLRVKFGMKYE